MNAVPAFGEFPSRGIRESWLANPPRDDEESPRSLCRLENGRRHRVAADVSSSNEMTARTAALGLVAM